MSSSVRGHALRALRRHYSTENTLTLNTNPFKLHRLTEGPSQSVTLERKDALELYKNMSLGRKLEAQLNTLYKAKQVRGFCHLYSGQEAVAVGIKAAMRPQDAVITSYRCHVQAALFNELSAYGVVAELLGKTTGVSRGKGGSMHMYGHQFYGGNGIVGSQMPIGTGIALSYKYRNTDAVCYTMYGDGAANNGQTSEVFNISKLFNLPVVYICENNLYGMGTSFKRAAANTAFYTRGDLMPGVWVDGMDVLAVREAAIFGMKHCLAGNGPILLEAETYRYFGHSLSDPGTSYRTREEIQQVRQQSDPIAIFKEKIVNGKLVTEDELKKIDADIKTLLDTVTKKAAEDKEPTADDLTTDVYNVYGYMRLVNPFVPGQHKSTKNKQAQ